MPLHGSVSCSLQVAQWITVTAEALMETLQPISHAHHAASSATCQ